MASPRLLDTVLIRFFRDRDAAVATFEPAEWARLIREARRSNLLSRIAYLLTTHGQITSLPEFCQRHLQSALCVAAASSRSVRWEVTKIHAALHEVRVPHILLKGAAYEMSDAGPGHGRLFGDVDIMVPKTLLEAAESALVRHGWMTTKLNAYDQTYYRRWMHEIPPMRHLERKTTIDVHHTILPPTAALKPDPAKLWSKAQEIDSYPDMFVFAPVDMVLHSAAHLFHDGEFEQGLRDLVDLDALLREHASRAGFWSELSERALEQGLIRPLFYALRYSSTILGTPVPRSALDIISTYGAPNKLITNIMDSLLFHAMAPTLRGDNRYSVVLARWLLYMRSHYLRMPLYRLLPHLLRKTLQAKG